MQDLPRLHCRQTLADGAEIDLEEGQARYLGTVLRRTVGDGVRLFEASGGEWQGVIVHLHRQRATIRLDRLLAPPAEEPGPLLVFALLKRDATDLVVRLATELGAARLLPVVTRRTVAGPANPARLRAIAIEAAEQCERLTVPPIDEPRKLADLLGAWPDLAPDRVLHAAIERPGGRAAARPWPQLPPARCALLVGPEGGFDPGELELLAGRPFVTPVSLGPRILRAETAIAAGLARLITLPAASPASRMDAHVEPR